MAKVTVITRVNPKTGEIERPWQDKHGNYVLGDPKHGSARHHRSNAVFTANYDEAVQLVRDGFSIRMAAKGTPASLIAPGSLTLEDIESDDPAAVIQTRLGAPFTREEILHELRRALVAQAAALAYWANEDAAAAFIGFPPEDSTQPYEYVDLAEVDLSRFDATRVFGLAYDFAFQVGERPLFGPDTWDDLACLMDSATKGVIASISPMANPDSALRRTAETAFARWKLEHESWLNLSVRELALLARMDESAARNALGRERITARGGIANDVAKGWLADRRGFVPTDPAYLPYSA